MQTTFVPHKQKGRRRLGAPVCKFSC